jgi:hypothetical protein
MTYRLALTGLCLLLAPQPVSAQIFWQAPDFHGLPIQPGETGVGVPLPGATPEEERANLAWQLRAGLNLMALQCQFDKTLLTENTYNATLTNHKAELEASFAKVSGYFNRVNKTAKAGQSALDRYGTKTYLGFSTVRGQLGFCHTGAKIAHAAIFTPRGSFTALAIERLRELRNSLLAAGEQQFRFPIPRVSVGVPYFEDRCWDKKGNYKRNCGMQL